MTIMTRLIHSRKNMGLSFALIIAAVYLTSVFVVPLSASAFSASPAVVTSPESNSEAIEHSTWKISQSHRSWFYSQSTVAVTFNGVTVDSGVAINSTGGFVTNFVVPTGTASGTYSVVATDASNLQASNTLTVKSVTKVILTTQGNPHIVGAMLTVSGSGFLSNTVVTVLFGTLTGSSPTTNSTGGF